VNPRVAGFLKYSFPAPALRCGQLQGEVIVHMLECLKQIVLDFGKGYKNRDSTWFHNFLAAIPRGDGLRAAKSLTFRLERWRDAPVAICMSKDPMIELAVVCASLRKLDLTVHFFALFGCDGRTGLRIPLSVDTLLDKLALRPLIKCERLCRIRIDVLYGHSTGHAGSSDRNLVVDIGKWLMKGFLVKQHRRIQIELCYRSYDWDPSLGVMLVLD
jgi:hypothetical protein